MEISIPLLILIVILTFLGAYIDNAFGQGYGMLSPTMIILGFEPVVVVPVLLLSQMSSGFAGSIFHSIFENVDLDSKDERDVKVTALFTISGMIGMTGAVLLAVNIPDIIISSYIGVMIMIIGIIMLKDFGFKFSWKKLYAIGGFASFNKALSGGGYGAITTAGQVMSGRSHDEAVATSVFSEAFLSGYGFLLYFIFNGGLPQFDIMIQLLIITIISSIIATPLGALTANRLEKKKAKKIIGYLSVILGIISIMRIIILSLI
ncbi:MAG: TSUP family transporter [Candidatus Lokiarchaeota archaeon]|nr:TSUP family transporter [Candidatus Lokiarchaeota archaeon]MBD3201008.1 TSUP family transporter [Candidatus Lokiarchaeota archaeon]